MTYGSETWAINTTTAETLAVVRCKMERIMLRITLRDRKNNIWIQQQSGVKDMIKTIKKSQHRCACHISHL